MTKRINLHHTAWQGAEFPPRAWQAAAYDTVMEALHNRERGVVRAVMGAGKSRLMAELVASVMPDRHDIILVTAPSVALVEQLSATLTDRLVRMYGPRGADRLGLWYGEAKQVRPIIVSTHDSLPTLSDKLRELGKGVAMWIADEAHRTNHKHALQFYKDWEPPMGLGFTATPYLSDETDCLALFDRELFAYDIGAALADGVVVPWEIRRLESDGTQRDTDLDEVCIEMIKTHLAAHPDHKGITNARTRVSAERFAAMLVSQGIKAGYVHGSMDAEARQAAMDDYRAGRMQVLVHVNVLVEGVDLPNTAFMVLRRPVTSRVRFAQEVGRGLRAAPGKTKCVVYDPLDLFSVLRLSEAAALSNGVDPEDLTSRIQDPVRRSGIELRATLSGLELESAQAMRLAMQADVGLRARVVAPITSYLRSTSLAATTVWPDKFGSMSRMKRSQPPSDKQLVMAARAGSSLFGMRRKTIKGVTLPGEHHDMLRFALTHLDTLNKGQVSDLITILRALTKHDFAQKFDMFDGLARGVWVDPEE